ncbi:MAG: hypothetical protein [Olavius algarvensis Delta 4 endosymbiont]|nr:MAG: hypothetical protein [Olavius algarvensis Delta 4 endosymbiont]
MQTGSSAWIFQPCVYRKTPRACQALASCNRTHLKKWILVQNQGGREVPRDAGIPA